MASTADVMAWAAAKGAWAFETASAFYTDAGRWLSGKAAWLAESTTRFSDALLGAINNMTSNEITVLVGLLIVMVLALLLPSLGGVGRRRDYSSRDARYRRLQDI